MTHVLRAVYREGGRVIDIRLTDAEVGRLRSYAAEVLSVFGDRFRRQGTRLEGFNRAMAKFTAVVEAALTDGRSHLASVYEAHNELCVANCLASTTPGFSLVQYEPLLAGTDRSIDFRAVVGTPEHQVFVDVKTIRPAGKNRWDQFMTARTEGWFPSNVDIALSKQWLGGELWHGTVAARGRMLEYTLELEQKIRDGSIPKDRTTVLIAFCGDGFYWTEDRLEDFVFFYRTGEHRADDTFSKMELDHIAKKKITLSRSVGRFAYMQRGWYQIDQERLNWDVRPPDSPSERASG